MDSRYNYGVRYAGGLGPFVHMSTLCVAACGQRFGQQALTLRPKLLAYPPLRKRSSPWNGLRCGYHNSITFRESAARENRDHPTYMFKVPMSAQLDINQATRDNASFNNRPQFAKERFVYCNWARERAHSVTATGIRAYQCPTIH